MCDLARHPNRSHCMACGECFLSDSAFDAHLGSIPKKGRPKVQAAPGRAGPWAHLRRDQAGVEVASLRLAEGPFLPSQNGPGAS